MCPHSPSARRVRPGNGRPLLWNLLLHGDCHASTATVLRIVGLFVSWPLNTASVFILTVTGWWRQNYQALENGDTWLRRARGATQHYPGQGVISGHFPWYCIRPSVNHRISVIVNIILVLLQTVFTGLDHHQKDAVFATCGQQVDIWDEKRSSPIRSFTWGVDSFSAVRFNPVEVRLENNWFISRLLSKGLFTSAPLLMSFKVLTVDIFPQTELLASCASDRSIVLYDMRESTPLKKVGFTFSHLLSPPWLTMIWFLSLVFFPFFFFRLSWQWEATHYLGTLWKPITSHVLMRTTSELTIVSVIHINHLALKKSCMSKCKVLLCTFGRFSKWMDD